MKNLSILGELSHAEFMRDYWQKKPLLIRQAIPNFKPLISRSSLFELASKNDVDARLITHAKQQWDMQHGPFNTLPAITKKGWTLLVQGVNLQDESVDALLRQFRFISDTRLDDLMISYATDTGGVGPHFDSYDVFLLQAHGKRRWQISAQKDLTLVPDLPLKILNNFQIEEEFILEPGDMLYLPPHYAHDGVAMGECMTYSIGFRMPSYQELGDAFLQFMADSIDLPGRYTDPKRKPTKFPAKIDNSMLSHLTAELNKVKFTKDDITIFLGEYLSEPAHSVVFRTPAKPLTPFSFEKTARKQGVMLSIKSRMLYYGEHLFINGISFAIEDSDQAILNILADTRKLNGNTLENASTDVWEALYTWYQDGWLILT